MPLKGVRSMSSLQHTAASVVATCTLGFTNWMAWATSTDFGAVATGLTMVGLAIIGLGSQALKQWSRARAEAWAENERLKIQIDADREKAMAGSLTAQVKRLQDSIDEGNKRTEDANKKLHDLRNEQQVVQARHHEEIARITRQLEMTFQELAETRAENRTLMLRLGEKVNENTGAIGRIVSPETETAQDMETLK